MQYSKTLIMDTNSAVQSLDELLILYRSIFGLQTLDELHQQLFNLLSQQKQLWTSHAQVLTGLKELILANIRQNPQHHKLNELLGMVIVHENRAFENANAYSPNMQGNPLAAWWPNPSDHNNPWTGNPRSLHQELPYSQTHKFIDKSTPIGSSGSCFAVEIFKRLKGAGFNYVVTEPNALSCANWGVIFNIPSFRMLVQKSFGLLELPRFLWRKESKGKIEYRDPFREEVSFESIEAYEAQHESHLKACREALTQVKVFIITLGLNEIWSLRSDPQIVFSRSPWSFSPYLVEKRILSFQENLQELQTMLDIWRSFNPELKLIVSVSPVPLQVTFQKDVHVVAATCYAKSLLRTVAHEFASRNKDVYYFPSFETVMYCSEKRWTSDERHIAPEAVDNVMALFEKMFVKDGISFSAADHETNNTDKLNTLAENFAEFTNPAFLMAFDTLKNANFSAFLKEFGSQFNQNQKMSLVLWLDSNLEIAEEAAYEALSTQIEALGIDIDTIPDIHIYISHINGIADIMPNLQGIIQIEQKCETNLLDWLSQQKHNLPIYQAQDALKAWQMGLKS